MGDFANILNTYAPLISAVSTVVIAIFSVLTWWVSRRIHQASIQREREMNKMYLNLASAIVSSGKGIGEPATSARLFNEQRDELLKFFNGTET